MRLLCLETSSPAGGVAIVEDGIMRAELIVNSSETYSRRIFASIESLFAQLHLDWQALNGIAVCVGPGSFTGIRIGIATAKGIALALGIGIKGVLSLDALAMNACSIDTNSVLVPAIDAKRGQIYTAIYESRDNNTPHRLCEPVAIKPEELTDLLPNNRRIFVLGNGIRLLNHHELQKNKDITFLPEQFSWIKPCSIGYIAHNQSGIGLECDIDLDINLIDAVYLRPSDAELSRNAIKSESFVFSKDK